MTSEPDVPFQYWVAPQVAPEPVASASPLNWVPPMAVTLGELAGKSTASPWVADGPASQSVAPESPAATRMVWPCRLACWKTWLNVLRSVMPQAASQLP